MKTKLITCCAFLLTALAPGQEAPESKTIEETLDYSNQFIELDVKFASDIEVKTWDRSEVYLKAAVSVGDPGYLEYYVLDIDSSPSRIHIEEQAEPMFKKHNKDMKARYGDRETWYNVDYEFNYVLYVPKQARFKISSINGDLKSELIEGDFEADLINGNIEIAEYGGDLELSTINGEIDLSLKNTSLVAETLHGNIYADESLVFEAEDRMIGQEIRGSFQNGAHKLRLKTINGNLYLRQ